MFYGVILLVLLIVAGVLLIDPISKSVLESQIRSQTGMDVKIGKVAVGLTSPTVRIENCVIYNTADFGGSPFIQMPELYLEYNRELIKSRILELKLMRLNLSDIVIVEGKGGRSNIDELMDKSKKSASKEKASVIFGGIDTLNLTLQTIHHVTLGPPLSEQKFDLKIKNEIFHDLRKDGDYQKMAMVLIAKCGSNMFFGNNSATNAKAPAVKTETK